MENELVAQALQDLQRQVEQATAQIMAQAAESQRTVERYEARLAELREVALQAAQTGARSSGRRHGLVDTKGVGRPATFDGNPSKWSAWSFKVENFIASVYTHGREALDWAASREGMIFDDESHGKSLGRCLSESKTVRELDINNCEFQHPKRFFDMCSSML